MLNKDKIRELAYLVKVDEILPMNADRLECARVGGWNCVVSKNSFKIGDIAVFFEIDSVIPDIEPFSNYDFLRSKNFRIKSQKIRGMISQGLLVELKEFNWKVENDIVIDNDGNSHSLNDDSRFLTKLLKITHFAPEVKNKKFKEKGINYKVLLGKNQKLQKFKAVRWLANKKLGYKLLHFLYASDSKGWPVGKFPGVEKTDQERCENMPWVLNDKSFFWRTEKCDGSSATYILERKKLGRFKFYVCSRNVLMLKPDQKCFYSSNIYWEIANKYDIEKKMKSFLNSNKKLKFVCWQGEICGPNIQNNPHGLSTLHLFCFHWTDDRGRMDIFNSEILWNRYSMEVVPIEKIPYVMPNDFQEFKKSADGFYNPSCCEGKTDRRREGYVYYKTDEPTFSFKNVSVEYLLKKGE